jgi:hypothetical protein
MDATFVHQRDVANILASLEDSIKAVEEREKSSPGSVDLKAEIQQLIDSVDRNLRLKAQAIVRYRLAQSRILPLKPAPAVRQPRRAGSAFPWRSAPLPPLTPLRRAGQPIHPIVTHPTERISSPRGRSLLESEVSARIVLPRLNWHDPAAPVPPIPPMAVEKYGLQQLTESGHIRNESLPAHLEGVVTVAPVTFEILEAPSPSTHFVLDRTATEPVSGEESAMPGLPPVPPPRPPKPKPVEDPKVLARRYFFPLIRGVPDPDSPEFNEFKRTNQNIWEQVQVVLEMLRALCEDQGFVNQLVDARPIADLSRLDPDEITRERLMKCLVDLARTKKKRPPKYGFGFIGPLAEHKAAVAIQSIWRGFDARRFVRGITRRKAAALMIQHWYRRRIAVDQFRLDVQSRIYQRHIAFEENQTKAKAFAPNDPHFFVHLLGTHLSSELGRLRVLSNPNASLLLFSRFPLPTSIADFLSGHVPDQRRLHFLIPQQRLPLSLPIEDVLASDARVMTRIKTIAGTRPIYLLPVAPRRALQEIAAFLGAFILAPTELDRPLKRVQVRELLAPGSKHLMEASEEISETDAIGKALTDLALTHLSTAQWHIRLNDGMFGWVNTGDLTVLQKTKTNADVLTSADVTDPHFREVLSQSIVDDIRLIVNTVNASRRSELVERLVTIGGTIEAGPTRPVSAPSSAFFVAPGREPEVIATWERLYISLFEPFAAIYPAFLANPESVRKKTTKIAAAFPGQGRFGISVVDFWYSFRELPNEGMKLTPDDLALSCANRVLPFWLAETVLMRQVEHGDFVYVQDRVILPSPMTITALNEKCTQHGLSIGGTVFFVQDLQEELVVGLVVVEETAEKLIERVYQTFSILCESVFHIGDDPSAVLCAYCSAIEFLKNQIENGQPLESSVLQRKVRVKEVTDSCLPKLFSFKEPRFRYPPLRRASHVQNPDPRSEADRQDQMLITTPTDGRGQERSLMVVSDGGSESDAHDTEAPLREAPDTAPEKTEPGEEAAQAEQKTEPVIPESGENLGGSESPEVAQQLTDTTTTPPPQEDPTNTESPTPPESGEAGPSAESDH